MIKKLIFGALFLVPTSLFAASYSEGKLQPTTRTSLVGFIGGIQDYLLGLVGGAAILFTVWGGLLYITSRGNKQQAEKAKKTLTYAIGGLILVLLAGTILRIINTALPTIIN